MAETAAASQGLQGRILPCLPLVAGMQHGGFKHSGYGKDVPVYCLEDYTRLKHVMSAIED